MAQRRTKEIVTTCAAVATQTDYVLGHNNLGISYMVGFGNYYPTQVHHRGASLPTTPWISCGDGFQYLVTPNPNP